MTTSSAVAVVGAGHWGKNLVRNFAEMDALEMVCEPQPEAQSQARKLAPKAGIVTDFEDVLGVELGGIVLATPAETHFELARRALEADKDVFVEKPLALNYEHGQILVRLAQERGRILMVGHVLEYHPAILRMRELVDSGALGKVQYLYSNRLSLGQVRREENILWSFAPHDMAVILRLVGQMPFQVVVCGGSYIQPNIADVTLTHMLFDNGIRAHIHVSWLHPFKEQRLVVIGTQKMASFDDVGKRLVLFDQRVEVKEGQPVPVKGKGEEIPFDTEEPLRLECQAFLEAVRTRRPPLTDGWSGLRVLRLLQAAQRSLMTNGEPVPVAEEFPLGLGATLGS